MATIVPYLSHLPRIDLGAFLRELVMAAAVLAACIAFLGLVLRSERRFRMPVPPKLAVVAAWCMFLLAPGYAHASALGSHAAAGIGIAGVLALVLGLGALFAIAPVSTTGTAAASSTTTPPTATPFYLQPGFLVGILGPVCAIIAAKFGIIVDPSALAGVIVSIGLLALGLTHQHTTVTAAAIDNHAQVTVAQITAAASQNAGTATTALAQAAKS